MTRRAVFVIRAGFAVLGLVCALAAADVANPPDLTRARALSREVTARDGTLLRAFLSDDGAWRIASRPADVSPRYLAMLTAYEDKRFADHWGVDVLALGRAMAQWTGAGHIVSGGSTLTMQVARLLEPRQHRTFAAKFRQVTRALELEHALTKNEILSLYLTLAPYGGNLEGIRAASLAYFGKEPRRLSLSEAALLVALPQSPETRRPDRHPTVARAARDRVLPRLALPRGVQQRFGRHAREVRTFATDQRALHERDRTARPREAGGDVLTAAAPEHQDVIALVLCALVLCVRHLIILPLSRPMFPCTIVTPVTSPW